jgi:hypothetical protein
MATTTTEVGLVNNALLLLGEKTITALDDSDHRAEVANQLYEDVRDEVTRAHNWNCAMVTETLDSPEDTGPDWGYDNKFDLTALDPVCIRVVRTENLNDEWNVEGGYLLSDDSEVNIKYLRQMDGDAGVALMDPLMRKAVAAKLAYEMALRLSASEERLANVARVYEDAIGEATHADAIEMSPHSVTASVFIDAHGTGTAYRPVIPYADY